MFDVLFSGCKTKDECSSHDKPVCGSDGRTYRNKCFFDVYKCLSSIESLEIVEECECKKRKCYVKGSNNFLHC